MSRQVTRFAATRGWAFWLLATLAGTVPVFAQEPPLHERIDQVLEAPPAPPLAALCSDGEFLRRVYLDLTGSVPAVSVTKAFLADSNPNKRVVLVDRLLASPQHIRHMTTTFDIMLMERRRGKDIKQEDWQKYLFDSFTQNKPWDRLAREILAADGSDEKIRAAAKFYIDREGEANLLTRDVGRMFFGMDLACCQCHDHPLVGTYAQSDFYGLYAFLSRGTLFTDKQKAVFYAEKAEGDVKFTSVFTKQQDETRPCLPGDFEIEEPVFARGQEYNVAPADGVRPIPKFSRRAILAESATNGSNRQFNRNIANRLWALMMGRGLVEPLDMHHLDNPPTHPELLDLLADEIVRMKFDMRAFVRELALSRAYQRSLQTPPDLTPAIQTAVQQLPALETQNQQVAASLQQSTEGTSKARVEYDVARKAVSAALAELAAANNAVVGAQKTSDTATKSLGEAQQQLTSKRDVAKVLAEAAAKSAEAAAKLAGDAELAQAAEKFKTRAGQLATEVAAAEKTVADREPPAKSAADALAAAQAAVGQVTTKLTAANQKGGEIRKQLATLLEKFRSDQLTLQTTRVRLQRAKSLNELGLVAAAADSSRKKLEMLQSEIAGGKQTVSNLMAQLPQLETAMAGAKTASDEAAKLLAEAQKQLAERQQTAQVVAEAVAKADAAVQKLPQDAELKQAADVVKARREKLQTEVAEMQKGMPPREQAAKATAEQLLAAQQKFTTGKAQLESWQKMLPEKEAQLPTMQAQVGTDQTTLQTALGQATRQWSQQFSVGSLEPLSPEQLTWSILTVTGVVDQYRATAEAEVNKTLPLDTNAPADPAKIAEREKQIEQQVYDKLQGNVGTFVGLFGHAGGQPQRDFFATVDQALYFANAGVLQGWLNPSGENLLGRLIKLNEAPQVAEELYVSVLMRSPTAEEINAVANYLQARTNDRQVALQELAWALITSNEFRFSY